MITMRPSHGKMLSGPFDTWEDFRRPKGTLDHCTDPREQTLAVAAMGSPHNMAQQNYLQELMTEMVVRHARGEAMDMR